MKPKLVSVKASKLVILALHDIEVNSIDEEGATLPEIAKYVSAKYKVDYKKAKGSVHAVLARGVTFGIFAENNGRYKLEEVPEPPLTPPKSKTEKLDTLIVENSKSAMKRKKPNKGDFGVDVSLKPWVDGTEENSCKDCRQMAKRRKALSVNKNKNRFSESEEEFRGIPSPLF